MPRSLSDTVHPEPPRYPSGTVRALLDTDNVSPATRQALQERLTLPSVEHPRFFDPAAFRTLRAVCARLIPQDERERPADLAGAIDTRLADGVGDGWRFDLLPPDGEAYQWGLLGLDETAWLRFSMNFADLDGEWQDQVLTAVQRGQAEGDVWTLIAGSLFFQDLLVEIVEIFVADPLVQETMGYAGMADRPGWQRIGLNQREDREPSAQRTDRG